MFGNWLIGLCLVSNVACTEGNQSDDYSEYSFPDDGILLMRGSDVPATREFSFPAYVGDVLSIQDAISVSVDLESDPGFRFCIRYFDRQACGESPSDWMKPTIVELRFPCQSHNRGFLIEVTRRRSANGSAANVLPLWLAYANSEIAAVEGETPEALLPMFVCGGE